MKRHSLAVTALFVGIATGAQAFDLPPMVEEAPEIPGITAASGWYIRGDLGYNAGIKMDNPSYRIHNSATDSYHSRSFDRTRLDGDFSLSAGAGYQFNDFFRSDMTLDYFRASLDGKSGRSSPCSVIEGAGTNCQFSHKQSLSALSLLANGYVEGGTYFGITPYLGAGAGVANVDWSGHNTTKHCVSNSGGCSKYSDYKTRETGGAESWRFAYALMAGASYDISRNTKIDFGYRYYNIAGGDMFDWSTYEAKRGALGGKGKDKGFSRHEFRVGLRLTGW